jgi:hypothetical protein
MPAIFINCRRDDAPGIAGRRESRIERLEGK